MKQIQVDIEKVVQALDILAEELQLEPLKNELGVLAEPKAKTGKVLPQETVTTVKDFYTNDE